jgi:tyrosinase
MTSAAKAHVRREVRSLPPGDQTLPAYARAVEAMRKRPHHDPTSWFYQAAIHGSEVRPAQKLWNQCRHGSWFFVAWHRMFVYYFERIVRAAVIETGGPKDWALPYWNYGLEGAHASLPEAFRKPTRDDGTPNPLYVAARAPGVNGGAMLPHAVTSDAKALARPRFAGVAEFGGGTAPPNQQFWSHTGRLEQTPHNDIHNAVGGRGGWMANPDEAAQDPIFWLHHSNIDRIWAAWSARGNADPGDSRWTGQSFEFFDANGKRVAKTCGEVRDTIEDLGYTYDPPPAGRPPSLEPEALMPTPTPSEPKIVGATTEKLTLTGSSAAIPVAIDQRARQEVRDASSESDPRRLFLNLEDIEGEVNPGSVYGIYVDLPADAGEEELAAHHVGNVSFFGIERARNPRDDEHAHNLRVSVEVGDLLRSLGGGDTWDGEQIEVTLRPLTLIPAEGQAEELAQQAAAEDPPVHIGRVSLSVD